MKWQQNAQEILNEKKKVARQKNKKQNEARIVHAVSPRMTNTHYCAAISEQRTNNI